MCHSTQPTNRTAAVRLSSNSVGGAQDVPGLEIQKTLHTDRSQASLYYKGGSLLTRLDHHGNLCLAHNLVPTRFCSEFNHKIGYKSAAVSLFNSFTAGVTFTLKVQWSWIRTEHLYGGRDRADPLLFTFSLSVSAYRCSAEGIRCSAVDPTRVRRSFIRL